MAAAFSVGTFAVLPARDPHRPYHADVDVLRRVERTRKPPETYELQALEPVGSTAGRAGVSDGAAGAHDVAFEHGQPAALLREVGLLFPARSWMGRSADDSAAQARELGRGGVGRGLGRHESKGSVEARESHGRGGWGSSARRPRVVLVRYRVETALSARGAKRDPGHQAGHGSRQVEMRAVSVGGQPARRGVCSRAPGAGALRSLSPHSRLAAGDRGLIRAALGRPPRSPSAIHEAKRLGCPSKTP